MGYPEARQRALGARLVHLDLLRGLAALMVCAGHLRSFMMVDWGAAVRRTPVDAVFYAMTGLAHQAVIVFFVLSGFLVGGSAVEAWVAGRFSWQDYALRRLTRLWIVLVPALLLTLGWDTIGRGLSGGIGYDGAYHEVLSSGPVSGRDQAFQLSTLVGNIFFVQTVLVPTYGTNSPLWSLSNEFWYYVTFPLGLGVYFGRGVARGLYAVGLGVILWWLPSGIVMAGAIWLMGVMSWAGLRLTKGCSRKTIVLWRVLGAVVIAASLALNRRGHWFGSDYVLGLCVAATLPSLASHSPRPVYDRVVNALAEVSYTLYLTHFPFLAFVWFAFMAPQQMQPDLSGYTWFGFALTATVLYASGIWWLFERRTPELTRWARSRLQQAQPRQAMT